MTDVKSKKCPNCGACSECGASPQPRPNPWPPNYWPPYYTRPWYGAYWSVIPNHSGGYYSNAASGSVGSPVSFIQTIS